MRKNVIFQGKSKGEKKIIRSMEGFNRLFAYFYNPRRRNKSFVCKEIPRNRFSVYEIQNDNYLFVRSFLHSNHKIQPKDKNASLFSMMIGKLN